MSFTSSVDISFNCLPLRTVGRLDIPLDASPKFRKRCENILAAMEKHGSHNTYFLYNASAVYGLTNDESVGRLDFSFEGVVLTDSEDQRCVGSDLNVNLTAETCGWITAPIVEWFCATVQEAVKIEFNRYIADGDLEKAQQRLEKIQSISDEDGGFMGMYL